MHRSIRGLVASAALLLVAVAPSWAGKPKIDLAQHPLAQRMQVEIRMPQQEIIADSTETNPMMFGGGLLGALISIGVDNSAAKKAEKEIGPFRDRLVDVDWRKLAQESIEQGLSRDVFAPEIAFSFHTTTSYADRKAGTLAEGRRILVIMPSYLFAGQFSALKVHLDVAIVDRTLAKGRIKEKVLYQDGFDYAWVLRDWDPKSKRPARIAAWQEVPAEQLVAMLRESFTAVVALFDAEIRDGLPQPRRDAKKIRYPATYGWPKARLMAQDGTKRTFRVGPFLKGTLDVVP